MTHFLSACCHIVTIAILARPSKDRAATPHTVIVGSFRAPQFLELTRKGIVLNRSGNFHGLAGIPSPSEHRDDVLHQISRINRLDHMSLKSGSERAFVIGRACIRRECDGGHIRVQRANTLQQSVAIFAGKP